MATVRSGNCIGGGDWTKDRIVKDCAESFVFNKTLTIRSPKATRPWQHVIEPVFGYIRLAEKLYFQKKYSGAWNFGSKKGTVTSVFEVVKKIIKYWGKGKVKINNKKQFYEQENLQLDISKSKKILKWNPKYSIDQSVRLTVEWYKYVYLNGSKNAEKISYKQIQSYMND